MVVNQLARKSTHPEEHKHTAPTQHNQCPWRRQGAEMEFSGASLNAHLLEAKAALGFFDEEL